MNTTFIDRLDETTGRYLREALAESNTDNEVREQLAVVAKQAAEAAQDVEAGASAGDALAFTRDLDSFLTKARAKALESKRIESDIQAKLTEVAKTQAELEHLSASMPALAAAVNQTLDRYEEARHDYNANEFKTYTLSTRLSMQRAGLTELRRRLEQIKGQEIQV